MVTYDVHLHVSNVTLSSHSRLNCSDINRKDGVCVTVCSWTEVISLSQAKRDVFSVACDLLHLKNIGGVVDLVFY